MRAARVKSFMTRALPKGLGQKKKKKKRGKREGHVCRKRKHTKTKHGDKSASASSKGGDKNLFLLRLQGQDKRCIV